MNKRDIEKLEKAESLLLEVWGNTEDEKLNKKLQAICEKLYLLKCKATNKKPI